MSAAVDGLIGPLADASSVMKLDKDIHEASVQVNPPKLDDRVGQLCCKHSSSKHPSCH
jgi:hypothetical protein